MIRFLFFLVAVFAVVTFFCHIENKYYKKKEYYHRTGIASWYGQKFHGKKMANGEIYNQNNILVAHRFLPLGIHVRVTNLLNGKSIIAPVLDRGPYIKSRELDLSLGAAKVLGAVEKGIIPVSVEILGPF